MPFPRFRPRLALVVLATLNSAPCLPSRRYRKGFELQPTLYSGINLTVLLIVAGQQFENSMELRKIGKNLVLLFSVKMSAVGKPQHRVHASFLSNLHSFWNKIGEKNHCKRKIQTCFSVII